MDALFLISGFLGLLIFEQALRMHLQTRAKPWAFLMAFGVFHTAAESLSLISCLNPEIYLGRGWIVSSQGAAFLSLFVFGILSWPKTTPRRLLSREDLLPIFWFLLLAIACAWGWRTHRWAGLETVLRHSLALPAGVLTALSLLPHLTKGTLRSRLVSALTAVGWLVYGLSAGLATRSDILISLGLDWTSTDLENAQWITTVALGLVWFTRWIQEREALEQTDREGAFLLTVQQLTLALAILLSLVLARWQESFHLENFRGEIQTTVFQFRAVFSLQGDRNLGSGPEFIRSLSHHLHAYEVISKDRAFYTLFREDGRVVFGPSFGSTTHGKHPLSADFSITPRDLAVFERGESYVAGPNWEGGRFVTAVTPIRDPATGTVVMGFGLEVGPGEWNQVRQQARQIPLLIGWVLGILCLSLFSGTLRQSPVGQLTGLKVEAIAVVAFGGVLTATLAWMVADRSQAVRTGEIRQNATTLALWVGAEIEQAKRDLTNLAQHFQGAKPTAERFQQELQAHEMSQLQPGWILVDPDETIVATASSTHESTRNLPQPGNQLQIHNSSSNRVMTIRMPDGAPALLVPIRGRPGWRVGAILEPFLVLKIAKGRLGPAHQEIRATLMDLTPDVSEPLTAQPGFEATSPTDRASAPVFVGDKTWVVWAGLPPVPPWIRAEVVLALLTGTVITGMTLLVVIYLKRRQDNLEVVVAARTSELQVREIEARELYERLQRIASQVPGVVFQLKRAPDGMLSFPYLSEAARHVFGVPAYRLLSEASLAFERIEPKQRTRLMRSLEESARDMAPWREEFRLERENTPETWFEGSAIPQRLPDGSVIWSGVFYDITERKQYESELVFRATFQELLTEMAGSFLKVGMEGIDQTLNHILERVGSFVGADRAYLFQFDRVHHTVSNTHEWVAPGIRPEKDRLQDISFDLMPEVIESQMAGRQFLIPDVSALPPSPFKKTLEDQEIKSLVLLPLIEEGVCFGFAGFDAVRKRHDWRDQEISLLQVMASMVTQMLRRRKDEQALRESEDRLRRNWEFTRTLLNAIPTPVFYMDREGRFLGCNRSYLDFTGRTVENFAGKTVFDLFDLEQAEQQHAKDLELLRTGDRQSYEGTITDMLGRKREVIFNRDVFRNEKGEISGLVGSFIDISRVRKAEQEQREMERQLLHSQKLESLGVLAGGVAHDFNNILLAITGNLELARLDLPEGSDASQAIDNAFLATRRAVDLTRQMLAYSGKGHFVIEDIDLNRLITENLAIFKAAVAKNVIFEYELTHDLPPIRGDIGQIQQVIMNLITNGSEAIGSKAGTVKISSYLSDFTDDDLLACQGNVIPEPGHFVVLQVSDTGVGMDRETLARIFEPFFSTKFTGRGLGMAAVLGILRGHNGGILIDSTPGQGSRVRVLFPASLSRDDVQDNKNSPDSPSQDDKLCGCILLADDEPDVRAVCSKLLQRIGLEVHAVEDGMEAVLAIEAQPLRFDVALLDLTMPNMDGLATLAYFSKHYPKLPVILTSGYSREEVTGSAGADCSVGFVQKPFRLEELQAELSRVLNASSIRS